MDHMEHPGAVAYGKVYPEFWVQIPIDGYPATVGNGIHFGFIADSKTAVNAFHEAVLAAGGTNHRAPGPRQHYGEPHYGCFVRDFDEHRSKPPIGIAPPSGIQCLIGKACVNCL